MRGAFRLVGYSLFRQSRAMMSRRAALALVAFFIAAVAVAGAHPKIFNEKPRRSATSCVTSTGDKGVCTSIYRCPPLLMLFQQVPLQKSDMEYLRSNQCGIERNVPMVCCVPE